MCAYLSFTSHVPSFFTQTSLLHETEVSRVSPVSCPVMQAAWLRPSESYNVQVLIMCKFYLVFLRVIWFCSLYCIQSFKMYVPKFNLLL